ncbi:SH3 domain-containing protein [Oryctes borbonicus]|uniref:SH3 domain-containing protein n=1 Tax=Oryctes borbonicus TaxID=1629725 RepID=A0A0T6BHL2_9SCAR|nr:SH3 domain-containing protein [Oryctes borbonicus]
MNRERRKQALIKLSHLIKQDVDRERKSKHGLENLSRAIKQTPNFGAEDSNQTVAEKLYHMKSMLTYLEGARYKVQNALAELDSRPKTGHPLAPHITITRDKSGLQQSILKVPLWLKEQWGETEQSPISEKSLKSNKSDQNEPDWNDRGTADGNSNQPDSDFDEFSSQGSSAGGLCTDDSPVQPIAHCKALYAYTPNLSDELALHPGDILSVYRQQDDGWWLGECNGSVGIFPATYVETLPLNVIKC